MKEKQRLEAISHVLSTIFKSQEILKTLAPEYKWTGLGNLLGDYGDCIGVAAYSLEKAPPGNNRFDAITSCGKTVQIKATYSSKAVGIRGKADLLLVLKIEPDGGFSEVSYNSFEKALELSNASKRDNKRLIMITKLSNLNLVLKREAC